MYGLGFFPCSIFYYIFSHCYSGAWNARNPSRLGFKMMMKKMKYVYEYQWTENNTRRHRLITGRSASLDLCMRVTVDGGKFHRPFRFLWWQDSRKIGRGFHSVSKSNPIINWTDRTRYIIFWGRARINFEMKKSLLCRKMNHGQKLWKIHPPRENIR